MWNKNILHCATSDFDNNSCLIFFWKRILAIGVKRKVHSCHRLTALIEKGELMDLLKTIESDYQSVYKFFCRRFIYTCLFEILPITTRCWQHVKPSLMLRPSSKLIGLCVCKIADWIGWNFWNDMLEKIGQRIKINEIYGREWKACQC